MLVHVSFLFLLPKRLQGVVLIEIDAGARLCAFLIESISQPHHILSRRAVQPELPDPKRRQFQFDELSARCRMTGQVHHREIVTKRLVISDALVIVEEVAAAIEDGFSSIDLNSFCVVGGMTVNDVEARIVDQAMREMSFLVRHRVAPIITP